MMADKAQTEDQNKNFPPGAAAFKDGEKPGDREAEVQVRDAGKENMASKQKKWDEVDDAMDQSFPASDPPSY
jgi:hypothetical protein